MQAADLRRRGDHLGALTQAWGIFNALRLANHYRDEHHDELPQIARVATSPRWSRVD
jgi:hypothetical protein